MIECADINEATDQLADGKAVRQVIMFNAVDAVENKPRPARHAFGNPAQGRQNMVRAVCPWPARM
ncbi:hypothetical protein E5206_02300 [Arthrobacter sp. PAMC25564]|nr:hypothetical protein E5206_02300 [Arthrobacter sp. PAMC25564]